MGEKDDRKIIQQMEDPSVLSTAVGIIHIVIAAQTAEGVKYGYQEEGQPPHGQDQRRVPEEASGYVQRNARGGFR